MALDLVNLRERLGLTQAQLAGLVGVHAMTVSKWERGRLKPSAHQRRLLATFAAAAERGVRAPTRGKRPDALRFLAELLAHAEARPAIELGTLSATNRLSGRVVELVRGDVMTKLVVEIAPGMRLGAVITTDSVDRLGLVIGASATAVIKATDVMLAAGGTVT